MSVEKVVKLQQNLLEQISTHPAVDGIFKDITTKEFPFCKDWPAVNINVLDVPEQAGYPAIPFVTKRAKVRVYVSMAEKDLNSKDRNLWDTYIKPVEAALKSDRYCGLDDDGEPLCNVAVTEYSIRTVRSPIGDVIGVRAIEFNAELVTTII